MHLESGTLPTDELTAATAGLPWVVTAPTTDEPPLAAIIDQRQALRARLTEHGAVLFRHCGIRTVEDFHGLMEALDIPSCDPDHYYGEVMRAGTGTKTMEPTHMPANLVIAPHNESAFWYAQPEHIAFFCESTTSRYGQTPIFDCARITERLPADILAKLRQSKIINEYVFDSLDRAQNLLKNQKRNCWQTAFQKDSREEVEAILDAREDVSYSWRARGELHIAIRKDVFATHPLTRRPCFQAARAHDFEHVQYMLQHYARHQLRGSTYMLARGLTGLSAWLTRGAWIEHQRYAWKTSIEGPPLTPAEIEHMTDALFSSGTIFRWHAGDVLVIDNVRTAHGRLNIDGERRLHVFMGAYIDQREL